MSEPSVRPARPADVAAIQRVAEASWHAAHDDIVGTETVDAFLADHYDRESVERGVRDDESAYRVAELTGEVTGFAVAVPHEGATWALGALYVHPERWGNGAGTALLDAVEDAVRTGDGESLRLVVIAENERARGFYESRGYTHVSDSRDDALDVTGAVYRRPLGHANFESRTPTLTRMSDKPDVSVDVEVEVEVDRDELELEAGDTSEIESELETDAVGIEVEVEIEGLEDEAEYEEEFEHEYEEDEADEEHEGEEETEEGDEAESAAVSEGIHEVDDISLDEDDEE